MVISIQSQLRNSIPRPKMILNIVRRSATLIFLGLVINSIGNNDLRTFRIPGVLQRFGFAYLIVGIMQAIFAHRELPSLSEQHLAENTIPWWWPARDIKVHYFTNNSETLKFIYSEKATKIWRILKKILTYSVASNRIWRFCHIFLALSENINFDNVFRLHYLILGGTACFLFLFLSCKIYMKNIWEISGQGMFDA